MFVILPYFDKIKVVVLYSLVKSTILVPTRVFCSEIDYEATRIKQYIRFFYSILGFIFYTNIKNHSKFIKYLPRFGIVVSLPLIFFTKINKWTNFCVKSFIGRSNLMIHTLLIK